MNELFRTYQNGNYLIHNVPYAENGSGELYLTSQTLKQLSELIEYMTKEQIFDLDFKMSFKTTIDTEQLYKNVAVFELMNMDYYKQELEKTTNLLKKQQLIEKIRSLEEAVELLDLPSKELIYRKYLNCTAKQTDKTVIESLKINRKMYYLLKTEALLRIGRFLHAQTRLKVEI